MVLGQVLVHPDLHKAIFVETDHFWLDFKVAKSAVKMLEALQGTVQNAKTFLD